jgi:hypothetical protein
MILVSIASTATPPPFVMDPRPCGLCGLTEDRHEAIDDGEGPLFFCADIDPDEMTTLELERRAVLIEREEVRAMVELWERADPRDCWKHTGEAAPPDSIRNGPAPEPARQSNRPAQSTVDAFWYVVSLCDPERFKAWLADHPRDTTFLLQLLETK